MGHPQDCPCTATVASWVPMVRTISLGGHCRATVAHCSSIRGCLALLLECMYVYASQVYASMRGALTYYLVIDTYSPPELRVLTVTRSRSRSRMMYFNTSSSYRKAQPFPPGYFHWYYDTQSLRRPLPPNMCNIRRGKHVYSCPCGKYWELVCTP
jgi:hypothetical protein